LSGTAYDLTKSFGYNPASQMTSVTTSNDAYASNVPDRGTTGFTTNGLNEFATIDGGAVSYDTNGNLTIDPWLNHSFSYNAEDQMTAASQLSATAGLSYDPLGRLDTYNPSSGAFRRFVYDGDEVSAELDSSGSIVNRYIRGDAPDEVLLQYAGSGSSSYRYYHLDERMSLIAWSDEAGAMAAISHYDEFGIPAATNPGRFQYTGQMWLSEIGEYFYKTRGYSANMGQFLQTDRMGYAAGPNLYEYAGSDPVNLVDPLGLEDKAINIQCPGPQCAFVIGTREPPQQPLPASLTGGSNAIRPPTRPSVAKPKPEPKNCIPASAGPVYVTGAGFSLVIGLGASLSIAHFSVPSIGASGWITSGGGHVGIEGFAGGFSGRYDTLRSLLGAGWQFTSEVPGILGVGYGAYSSSLTGEATGGFGSVGVGGGASLGRVGTRLTPHSGTLCK